MIKADVELYDKLHGQLMTMKSQFDALHHIVAKPVIEFAFDVFEFGFVFFGERLAQVFGHQPTAVACQLINQQIQPVGQHIEHSERQERQHIDDGVEDII